VLSERISGRPKHRKSLRSEPLYRPFILTSFAANVYGDVREAANGPGASRKPTKNQTALTDHEAGMPPAHLGHPPYRRLGLGGCPASAPRQRQPLYVIPA